MLPTDPSDRRAAQIVALIGLGVTLVLGLLSDGVHHDDDVAHFLMARWVGRFPEYLLHFWGRPGFTVPHAALAWIGAPATAWHLCRALSALLTFATVRLAIGIAERLTIRPLWVVALAYYAQPYATLLACTTLTETCAAFYVVTAVALFQRRRFVWAATMMSLAFVTRWDTLAIAPVWALGLVAAWYFESSLRRSRWGLLSPLLLAWGPLTLALLLRYVVGVDVTRAFLAPHGSTQYTADSLLAYVPHALLAIPPLIMIYALIGWPRSRGNLTGPLIATSAAVFVLAHVVLFGRGLYASGGFARFQVTIAPLIAILAAAGWQRCHARRADGSRSQAFWIAALAVMLVGLAAFWLECRAGRIVIRNEWVRQAVVGAALVIIAWCAAPLLIRRGYWHTRLAGVAVAVLGIGLAVQWAGVVRPLRLRTEPRQVRDILAWIDAHGLANRPCFAATPWVAYYRDWAESPRVHKGPRLVASMPVGTLVLWDGLYCPSDFHRLQLEDFVANPAYRELGRWGRATGTQPSFVLFEKLANTPIPEADPPSYPLDIMATEAPGGWYYLADRVRDRTRP